MKNHSWRKVYLVSALTLLFVSSPLITLQAWDEITSSNDPALNSEETGQRGWWSHEFTLKSDATTKIWVTPEYTDQTGFSLGVGLATMFTNNFGVGLLGSYGEDKYDALINVGLQFADNHRLVATYRQLQQNLEFDFASGKDEAEATQNSWGLSYQYFVGNDILNSFELNAYLSDTGSENLTDKTYSTETATMFELWNDPRRVAGGKVTGLQGKITILPLPGTTVKLGGGMEELEYDYLTGLDKTSRATGEVQLTQELPGNFLFDAWAATMAAMDTFDLALSKNFSDHQFAIAYTNIQGRDGVPDDNQYAFSYRYSFGSSQNSQPTAQRTDKPSITSWSIGLLNVVAKRPSFLPSQVVAKIDTTAEQNRLITIDKTALPTGTNIDAETGIITVPLGIAVTSIARTTRDGAPFTNTGQFSLMSNYIVINPNLITQPAAWDTDLYAVTINNSGGGTTLVNITVSRGSVQIDSIIITAWAAAATAPGAFTFTDQTNVALNAVITSAAITISGINTASAISITSGEYELNGSGTWTSGAGTVKNGDTVRVRHTSSGTNGTAVDSVLTIGWVSDTFTSTTVASTAPTNTAPTWESFTVDVWGVSTWAEDLASRLNDVDVGDTVTATFVWSWVLSWDIVIDNWATGISGNVATITTTFWSWSGYIDYAVTDWTDANPTIYRVTFTNLLFF